MLHYSNINLAEVTGPESAARTSMHGQPSQPAQQFQKSTKNFNVGAIS